MWPNRHLSDLLGIEHPIVLSPMSGIGTVDLASAVCAAGGLGAIGCAVLQPDRVASEIEAMRARTDAPFSVNFFCHSGVEAEAAMSWGWLNRLSCFYRELVTEFDASAPRREVAPFGDTMCRLVEKHKPAVVSFHFGL